MSYLTIDEVDITGKKVFVSVDYNVPLSGQEVANDERIRATLPTLDKCFERGAEQLILASHLSRPQKKIKEALKPYGDKPTEEQRQEAFEKVKKKYNMSPVANKISQLLSDPAIIETFPHLKGRTVQHLSDSVGVTIPAGIDLVVLENLRLDRGEEKNEQSFAAQFVGYADIMVQDAFGRCHRAHASTDGIVQAYKDAGKPVVVGPLVLKEIQELEKLLQAPREGYIAVLGGLKVSDKIGVIDSLLDYADSVLIGGAMAYTFLKFKEGVQVGKSIVENEIQITKEETRPTPDVLNDIYAKAAQKGVSIYLPQDHVAAESIESGSNHQQTDGKGIPDNLLGVDIGAKTIEQYKSLIAQAKTILWNGPMGVFEVDAFGEGTKAVALAIADSTASVVIGGGDSLSAISKYGLQERLTTASNVHLSTGGGASLEFMQKSGLIPGLVAVGYEGVK